ncbi:hypothetical protein [Roseibium sp. RKSG952]|uniref:hypothetical protein n=1 Tax=Roseibium sp. RKSG952 TaxID=2529384 RepID=UPI0012BBBD2E|nr:hypothetical protein [Roseibium sp. RKSG952]MTH99157.1 hypothetical protein [Roseibium sp. RKSG952]
MRIYPLDPQGAAEGTLLVTGAVNLRDLSHTPRFGLKGRGTVAFLQSQGILVPGVNEVANGVLRLGSEEVVVLDGPTELRASWEAAQAPKGYYAWREETWAMMHLSGERLFDLMAKICPVDLSVSAFAVGRIAQTRVGYVEAITWRNDRDGIGFDLLFDIAATAFFADAVATASAEFNREVTP